MKEFLLIARQIEVDLIKKQSIKIFSSGYTDMVTTLNLHFNQITFENDYGFF